jgi:hypothetical protein
MDEQLSTWMDWIWSCRCLPLSCTSTQSSSLKWVSGGGINSPRHPKSRWLTATEKVSVGWTDAMIFQGVGSSSAPLTSHSRWGSLTELLRRYASTVRRFIRCWRPRGQTVSVSFHATVGWTAAEPSVHPLLKASSLRVSVLFKLDHQIVRRFPPMDRRFIRRCCLCGFSSPIHPTQLGKGPSVHPTVSS